MVNSWSPSDIVTDVFVVTTQGILAILFTATMLRMYWAVKIRFVLIVSTLLLIASLVYPFWNLLESLKKSKGFYD
jgi:hypothetical protein